jgi:hypothetical protein
MMSLPMQPEGFGFDSLYNSRQDIPRSDEFGDTTGCRTKKDVIACALLDHLATVVDNDLLTEGKSVGQIVCHKEYGDSQARLNLYEFLAQRGTQRRIERGEWFIEQEQPWLYGQSPRHSHSLLLTAGKFTWTAALQTLEFEELDQLGHSSVPLLPREASETESDVFRCAQMRKESVVLRDIPNTPYLRREIDLPGTVVHRLTIDDDTARLGLYRTGDGLQGEAFAGARRAEENDKLVLRSKGHVEPKTIKVLLDPDLKHKP